LNDAVTLATNEFEALTVYTPEAILAGSLNEATAVDKLACTFWANSLLLEESKISMERL
jgi:hypothetical protein